MFPSQQERTFTHVETSSFQYRRLDTVQHPEREHRLSGKAGTILYQMATGESARKS